MVSDPGDMRVMLTPPDIWGSTGYVTTDAEDNTNNMYKVRGESLNMFYVTQVNDLRMRNTN